MKTMQTKVKPKNHFTQNLQISRRKYTSSVLVSNNFRISAVLVAFSMSKFSYVSFTSCSLSLSLKNSLK